MQEKQGNIEIKEPEYVLIATVHEIQCVVPPIFSVLNKNKNFISVNGYSPLSRTQGQEHKVRSEKQEGRDH